MINIKKENCEGLNSEGLFGLTFQTHVFTFKTTLHIFSHIFSPTRISKNYKQPFSNYSTKHPLNVAIKNLKKVLVKLRDSWLD